MGILRILICLNVYFEIALRMVANRAYLGSIVPS
jgi:hypothetical protein